LARCLGRFARNRIHFFQGMNGLISAFYESALGRGEPPTPPAEIIRVTRMMDQIFASCLADGDAK